MQQRRYFGTDGIRDVANRGNLTPDMVMRIGHAIGHVVRRRNGVRDRPKILVVRDTRVSGPMIAGVLTGTLLAHGADIHDAGVLPTPACALLVRRGGYDIGIVISASHNPMRDNGIKVFGPDGRKLSDSTEVEIEHAMDRAGSGDVEAIGADIGRAVAFPEGESIYLEAMTQEFFADVDLSGTTLVIDCAHGSGFRVAPRILAALGAHVVAVNNRPDGLNINDEAGVFHAAALSDAVRREGATAGIVLDGDGDRVMLVDENGTVLDGDDILAILATAMPPHAPRVLVTTVMSNMGLVAAAKRLGLAVHLTPVGDRYVAERMEETDAWLGGEQSGHVIFSDAAGWFGDGIYTALKVIDLVRSCGRKLSELARAMERYPQVLQNVIVAEKPPLTELSVLQEAIRRHQGALGDEGRVLVRYSGTEMLARVMVEGRSRSAIEAIAEDLSAVIRAEIGVRGP